MEHTRVNAAWQHNDELCVDALALSGNRDSTANGTAVRLFVRTVCHIEYFRRSTVRQMRQEKDYTGLWYTC